MDPRHNGTDTGPKQWDPEYYGTEKWDPGQYESEIMGSGAPRGRKQRARDTAGPKLEVRGTVIHAKCYFWEGAKPASITVYHVCHFW